MFGLGEEVGGDHRRVSGPVGDNEDFRRAGELVDSDLTEDLPLRLVDEGIAGADDLVDARDALGTEGHRRDRLRAADAEDAVSPREMTAGDHRRMGVRRQAGHDLVHLCHLRRYDRHDRCGEKRIPPSGNIATDPLDGDDAVAEKEATERFDVERQDGRELRLGKRTDVGDRKLSVGAHLRIEGVDGGFALVRCHLEASEIDLVESEREPLDSRIAFRSHGRHDLRNERLDGRNVQFCAALRGLDVNNTGKVCVGRGHRKHLVGSTHEWLVNFEFVCKPIPRRGPGPHRAWSRTPSTQIADLA